MGCSAGKDQVQPNPPAEHAKVEDAATEEVQPESKWDKLGCSALKKALKDTVMVDAAWLADLADKGGVVPRCQSPRWIRRPGPGP